MDRVNWILQVFDFGLNEIIDVYQTSQYFEAKSKTLVQEGATIDLRVEFQHELKYQLVIFVVYELHYFLLFIYFVLFLW
jgi:hypothetical protein